MRTETRLAFNEFRERIAEINGVPDASDKFAVDPSIQQKLIDKRQESSEFLSRINIVPVTEMKGAVLGLSVGSPIVSNTDTSGAGTRKTSSPSSMDSVDYECFQNNSDTHIRYALLDAWVFSGQGNPVRTTVCGGKVVVEAGRHVNAMAIRDGFTAAMKRLLA